MPEKGNALFGVELECIVPNDRLNDDEIGGYHSGKQFGAGRWVAEHDGSLFCGRWSWTGVELVSPVFSLRDLEKTIGLVQNVLGGKDDNLDGIDFNKSCGAHIHFSWQPEGMNDRCNNMRMQMPIRTIEWIRNTAFRKIKKQLPHIYPAFENQYFREYARKKNDLREMYANKFSEFHFTDNQGIEWRSFNLLGVRSWREIEEMLRIGCATLQQGIKNELYEGMTISLEPADFIDEDLSSLELNMMNAYRQLPNI